MVQFVLALALASIAGGPVHSHEPPAGNPVQQVTPQEPNLLVSAECQTARRELELVLSAATKNRDQDVLELDLARKRTTLACLGQASGSAAAAHSSQPVIVVPPIVTAVPPLPVIAAPPPPVKVVRPSVITACDAGGCWDREGVRLHRFGPNLIGPSGLCTAQGNLFNCP